ncbi:uncharacterized protein PFL1_01189 [Pseudozyma flocculosa PF-1]|uniref:uncharacterized protein n=1 Tax=Pseudozyma flocculosa PF-1 TaxID=1277687 RepID=UPI0004560C6D|nr:uncharacterized protein PFL1_01189 [Pseudozyma flocculosa PF-1]EPQ31000.1 hypothetical protein PFL1_01189 [Pseudozyma flocculosa PF-1]
MDSSNRPSAPASASAQASLSSSSSTDSTYSRNTATPSYPTYEPRNRRKSVLANAATASPTTATAPSLSSQPFPSTASSGDATTSVGAAAGAGAGPSTTTHSRTASLVGRKPLSLESQSVTSASSPVTPRRGKRMSLSYISSPPISGAHAEQTASPSLSSAGGDGGSYFSPRSVGRTSRSGSMRRPSNAAAASGSDTNGNASGGAAAATDGDDDWLMSDDNEAPSTSAAARLQSGAGKSMGERDAAKVESQFHDIGYREGITAGKLSTLQAGFDHGFSEVGAPIGRALGQLRGQIDVLSTIIRMGTGGGSGGSGDQEDGGGADADAEHDDGDDDGLNGSRAASPSAASGRAARAGTRRGRARARGGAVGRARADASRNKLAFAFLQSDALPAAQELLQALRHDVERTGLSQLAPPDYDALEHEASHAAEATGREPEPVRRETPEEVAARESILPRLQERLRHVYDMLGLQIG